MSASYSTILLVQGNKILYALGSEYAYGVMKSILALDPCCVKEPLKKITHILCVSVKIDSLGKSMFIRRRLYIGASAS